MSRSVADRLVAALPGSVFRPGDSAYTAAATPKNAVTTQRPMLVVRPRSAAELVRAVETIAGTGTSMLVQATGHGAARPVGDDAILLSTSHLDAVEIDVDRQILRCGPGAPFGAINAAAFEHGLLALSGTAPDVAPIGYTSFGGVGWLTRPHGLASAALLAVDIVDGEGRPHHSDDDETCRILTAAGTSDEAVLGKVELRHVAAPASSVAGAMTSCPGQLLLHAVGRGATEEARRQTHGALDAVLTAAAPFDTGYGAAAFRDGREDALDALSSGARVRLAAIKRSRDPAGTVVASRRLF